MEGAPDASSSRKFTLDVIATMKEAQRHHGLQNSNYNRYRKYCSRRLKRVRRTLRITRKRQRILFQHAVPADLVTDERFLLLPLFQAERCWAHAMELKGEFAEEQNPKVRHHMLRKLAKAVHHAADLAGLCAAVGVSKTSLEAEAYHLLMAGGSKLERGEWRGALEAYVLAKAMLSELAPVSDEYHSSLIADLMEELDVNLQYCHYALERADGVIINLDDMVSKARETSSEEGSMQERLQTIRSTSKERDAESLQSIECFGEPVPVRNDKFRLAYLEGQTRLQAVRREVEEGALSQSELDDLFQKAQMAFGDAILVLRRDLARLKDSSRGGTKVEEQMVDLQLLLAHMSRLSSENSAERSRYRAQFQMELFARSDFSDTRALADLIRLFESLRESLGEVASIPEVEQELPDLFRRLQARQELYNGFRFLFAGHQFGLAGEASRALALIQQAGRIADKAAQDPTLSAASGSKQDQEDVALLQHHVPLARCVVLANVTRQSAISQEDLSESLQQLTLSEGGFRSEVASVDELRAKVASILDSREKTTAHVCDFPPFPRPFPSKPIFLDLAFETIGYPAPPS